MIDYFQKTNSEHPTFQTETQSVAGAERTARKCVGAPINSMIIIENLNPKYVHE